MVARSCKRSYETMIMTKATAKTMTKAKTVGCTQLQEELGDYAR